MVDLHVEEVELGQGCNGRWYRSRQGVVGEVDMAELRRGVEKLSWDLAGERVDAQIKKLDAREVGNGGWDGERQGVAAEVEVPEATQPAEVGWDWTGDAGACEVEDGEE